MLETVRSSFHGYLHSNIRINLKNNAVFARVILPKQVGDEIVIVATCTKPKDGKQVSGYCLKAVYKNNEKADVLLVRVGEDGREKQFGKRIGLALVKGAPYAFELEVKEKQVEG